MNDFLLSILLGVVEGLTEFLPVSSTAHLRIVEALLRLDLHDAYWKMYTIVIQLGAILALPVYFWNRILKFLSTFPRGESGDRNIFTHPLGLTIIAFVITAVPVVPFEKTNRAEPGKSLGDGVGAVYWWHHHVAGGRTLSQSAHAANGRNVFASGSLDRSCSDYIGGFSRNITLDVNHRGRSVSRPLPKRGVGIFVFPFHADNGGCDRLRFAQDFAARQR